MSCRRVGVFLRCAVLLGSGAGSGLALELGGPEVFKLDWNTRALRAADLNGDGRIDLALINNDRATIELLQQVEPGRPATPTRQRRLNRWEPVLDDARFVRESVTTGTSMFDLALGDLNGDGRTDLAYTGSPQALTLRYHEPEGGWREERISTAPDAITSPGALKITDLDGDGRLDLLRLGRTELAVYRQGNDGKLEAPVRLPLGDENASGLEVADIDGDGRLDLVYVQGREPRPTLRVRLQTATNAFGPERAYPIERMRSVARALPTTKGPAQLAYVTGPVGQLNVLQLRPPETGDPSGLPLPRVFRPRQSGRTPAAYAVGDYNGDGQTDVAVTDPDGAQLSLYLRRADGTFGEGQWFPNLAEAQSLTAVDWDGDGRDELIVASAKERAVGLARVEAKGRLSYPQPLPVEGKPVAVAATRSANEPLLAVAAEDGGKRNVILFAPGDDGTLVSRATLALPNLRTDPNGLLWWDANQDGRPDLLVFVPRDGVRLFVQGEAHAFQEVSAKAGFRQGLLEDLSPGAVTLGDVDGDGREELLTGARGFARALRLNAEGSLTVAEQFNALRPNAEVSAALALSRKGGAAEIVLYDRRGEEFAWLQRNDAGVFETKRTQPAERLDVVGGLSSSEELFLFGADRFWWMPLSGHELGVEALDGHTSDLPQVKYADVVPADFLNDGRPGIVAIDPETNLIEVLTRSDSDEGWSSRLHFTVFEVDMHSKGNRAGVAEPREALVEDVTADGRPDLILLVHDRVLIYPQL